MDQTQRHLTTRQGATMNSAVGTGVPPPQTPEALAARVENFARGGASNREIAARLGLTRRWLKRRFRRQLRTGRAVLRMGLRQKQLQVASAACGKNVHRGGYRSGLAGQLGVRRPVRRTTAWLGGGRLARRTAAWLGVGRPARRTTAWLGVGRPARRTTAWLGVGPPA